MIIPDRDPNPPPWMECEGDCGHCRCSCPMRENDPEWDKARLED